MGFPIRRGGVSGLKRPSRGKKPKGSRCRRCGAVLMTSQEAARGECGRCAASGLGGKKPGRAKHF